MKGFKTVAFGLVLCALSIFSSPESAQFIAEHVPAIGSSIGTIVLVLRWMTTSPMFKGDKPTSP